MKAHSAWGGSRANTPLLLLWLGLRLSTRSQALEFHPPGPELRVRPHNILRAGSPVFLDCSAPLGADYFQVARVSRGAGPPARGEQYPAAPPGSELHLQHPAVRAEHGGRYRCRYRSHGLWSRYSRAADIIVSDLFSAPFLNITPTKAKMGERVTIRCKSTKDTLVFWVLIKGLLDTKNYVVEKVGVLELTHVIDKAMPSHTGMYTCYGHNHTNSHAWSYGSNPVFVDVRGNENGALTFSPGIYLPYAGLVLIPVLNWWA
ncbi:natural cytotoxicity triggering receptor 1-like [Macrotis lagotis]|uniref:natural cytotoxicity triggering receptor 1-like n=1 Tax=Macrotis lagotis TaxID=92651 RepID=UPI003D6954DA